MREIVMGMIILIIAVVMYGLSWYHIGYDIGYRKAKKEDE